ncbi:MAG: response regulator [Holophagaceae bacterium]|nr:response regulator [Holophagaceae bacterium]
MGSKPHSDRAILRLMNFWPSWLTPQGLTLARTEEERNAQAVERRFQYHGFQVPILRALALVFLTLMVILHTDTGGGSGLHRGLRFFLPAFTYWALSFALVRKFYRRVGFLDLGRVVAGLDVLAVLLAIHVTGSGKSLLLPVMLIPISFLALTSFRIALIASVVLPILYLAYMGLFGHSYTWGAEITKAFILLFSDIFLTLTSLVVHSWRARLNEALDISRDLIQQLEDRGAELAESKVKAEQASLSKSVFLSNMSHELRTPLNAILGYSQLLRRRNLEPDMEEQLGRIQRSGEHLLGLINDVLTISKIEAVGITATPAPFSPADLFRSLEDMIRIRAQDKGIAFLMELRTAFPEWVLGDENKLRQVLINLLGNAVKFTKQGHVRLAATYADGRAHFLVEDTGPGLSSEEIEAMLFHRFSQTDAGRKASEGTGLGLNISQAIARALGGEIQVESEVGQGTRFGFEIPLPPESLPATDPKPSTAKVAGVLAPGQEPPRILVVDDREENRDLLRRILEEAGAVPILAADGSSALDAIQEFRPDLVFLDIRMPGMDGFEVLQRIRKQESGPSGEPPQRLPVVALTASVLDHERDAVMARGFDEYIRKPFQVWEITDCISQFLGLRFIPRAAEQPSIESALPARSLSESTRKDLLAAIEIGDLDEALRILDAVEDQDAARPLRDLAKKYRFESLKDLLSQERPC